MKAIIVVWLILTSTATSQVIDLKMDFQTNSVMQLDRAPDGGIWGITSSNIDRLPTIAGIWAVRSTNGGASWDTSCITSDWWQWGTDIAAISGTEAYAILKHDDTLELKRTINGKTWAHVDPTTMGVDNVMSVHFYNARTGFIIGTEGRRIERKFKIVRTTDGGTTWVASLPLLPDPATETLADLNDRVACWSGAAYAEALNTGRILLTTDSATTWRFVRTPLRTVSAIVIIPTTVGIALTVYQTQPNGSVQATQTTDEKSWKEVVVPPSISHVYGARALANGQWVSIPRSLRNSSSVNLATGVALPIPPGCDALLPIEGGVLCGQELMPGKGLVKVAIP